MDRMVAEGSAEWDQRQAFHKRLHETVLLAHNSYLRNNYSEWFKALNVLYRELRPHANDEDRKGIDKRMDELGSVFHNKKKINMSLYDTIRLLINTQDSLHAIMRQRAFDVPIKEKRKGSVLSNEGSY